MLISLSDPLVRWLRHEAEEMDNSVSELVRYLLNEQREQRARAAADLCTAGGEQETRAPEGTVAAYAVVALLTAGRDPLACSHEEALETILDLPPGTPGREAAQRFQSSAAQNARFKRLWAKRQEHIRKERACCS